MSTTINLKLFSPRWGHDDTYEVELSKKTLKITAPGGTKVVTCTWQEERMPEWSKGMTLVRILQGDNIPASDDIQDYFEHVWTKWRNEEIDDGQAKTELEKIAASLNAKT